MYQCSTLVLMGRRERRHSKRIQRTGRVPDGAVKLQGPTGLPLRVRVEEGRPKSKTGGFTDGGRLRRLAERSTARKGDPLDHLEAVRELRTALDEVELEAWQAARDAQLSWSAIGERLAITRSGAHHRFVQLERRILKSPPPAEGGHGPRAAS